MRRTGGLSVWLLLAVLGCSSEPEPPLQSCPSFPGDVADGLSDAAAHEAFRLHEVRERLRLREAREPGHVVKQAVSSLAHVRASMGRICAAHYYEIGRVVFEHEFNSHEGLGNPARGNERTFHRVQRGHQGGPEAQSCASCHWKGGPAGAGAIVDNVFILADGDSVLTGDARNPPSLHGAGVVQALAAEMTAELQAQRKALVRGGAGRVQLVAKGVSFGELRVDARGIVDTSGVVGVDPDLVIKPFGWKGTHDTVRAFALDAFDAHLGIDGGLLRHGPKSRELSAELVTALETYVVSLGLPIHGPLEPLHDIPARASGLPPPQSTSFHEAWADGRALFEDLGCSACHKPRLVLKNPRLWVGEGSSQTSVDLSRDIEHPRLRYDDTLAGYPVWLFSDLKRHDLGASNASLHKQKSVPNRHYLTRRLWGLSHSSPYFYDGRAPTVDDAVRAHDGEARAARDAFLILSAPRKAALRVFLTSLRRAPRFVIP